METVAMETLSTEALLECGYYLVVWAFCVVTACML